MQGRTCSLPSGDTVVTHALVTGKRRVYETDSAHELRDSGSEAFVFRGLKGISGFALTLLTCRPNGTVGMSALSASASAAAAAASPPPPSHPPISKRDTPGRIRSFAPPPTLANQASPWS